jgi:hypothetical protein
MMDLAVVLVGLGCWAAGYLTANLYYRLTYRYFVNEMHKQYLYLLKKQGIKLNGEGEEMVKETFIKRNWEEYYGDKERQ